METLIVRQGEGHRGSYFVSPGTPVEVGIPGLGGVGITIAAIPLQKLEHGAVTTGPFVIGDVVTDGTSGATGQVVFVADGYVSVADVVGVIGTTSIITGSKSGASATLTANTQASGLARHSVSSLGDHAEGAGVYRDWDHGTVTEYTDTSIVSGVSAVMFIATDAEVKFEIVI